MIKTLLVARDRTSMSELKAGLIKHDVEIARAGSGSNGMSTIAEKSFDLVITDENLGDMTGLEFIRLVVSKMPMVNCAAVSSLVSEDFHEQSEGLGILMQLPVRPGQEHAEILLGKLKSILETMKV
jgi:DNA-binding response OmpR family regulator